MSEILPIYFDEDSDPRVMRLVYAYRPHTQPPSRQELLENKYQLENHCSIQELTKQLGMDYNEEIQKRS